jgi:hypothetical protein
MGLSIQMRDASPGVYVDVACSSFFHSRLQQIVEALWGEKASYNTSMGTLTYFCWTAGQAQELIARINQSVAPHLQRELQEEVQQVECDPAHASTWAVGYGIQFFSAISPKTKEVLLEKVLPYCPALVTRLAELGIDREKRARLEKKMMALLARDISKFFTCYKTMDCDLSQLALLIRQEIPYQERAELLMEFVWRDLPGVLEAEGLFQVSREDCIGGCRTLFQRLEQSPSRLFESWGLSLYLMRQNGCAKQCSQLMLHSARLVAKLLPSQARIPSLFFTMKGIKEMGELLTPSAADELHCLWIEYLVHYPHLLFPEAEDRRLSLLNQQVTAVARIHTKKGEDQDRVLRSAIKQHLHLFPKYAREMGELIGRASLEEGSLFLAYFASRDPVGVMLYRKLFAEIPLPSGVEEEWMDWVQHRPNEVVQRAQEEALPPCEWAQRLSLYNPDYVIAHLEEWGLELDV